MGKTWKSMLLYKRSIKRFSQQRNSQENAQHKIR